MAKIEISLPYVLDNEGRVYENVKGDAGGPTKFGITWRDVASYRHRPVSIQDMKDLTLEEATAIYKQDYWDICHLDDINDQGVATSIFDCAVNRGVGTARTYIKYVCGVLGKSAPNDCDPASFIKLLEKRMEDGYNAIVASHPSQRKFIRGWLNRAHKLLTLIKKKLF